MKRYRVLEIDSLDVLRKALTRLDGEFRALPRSTSRGISSKKIEKILLEAAKLLGDNYPYFHPLYAGQMLKPPHPVARMAYALAMWINPNNHALDGGRASSAMEKEAVAEIAGMFGWKAHLGHLTGGGTIANLEALWVAGQIQPQGTIVASEQAHYTHSRISNVLRLKFESVACDSKGRIDLDALEKRLAQGGVTTVVATMGTTATGSVDPLHEILTLKNRYGFRVHADAAYGGYFTLVDNLDSETRKAFNALSNVASLVIDPHKHGLQPYGCGCVIFQDPAVGKFYKHDSPYTYFSSGDLHLGEISLECSRPGAAAVGLWATQRLLPLSRNGEFSKLLRSSRRASLTLHEKLKKDGRFLPAFRPELDIVVWAVRASRVSESSQLAHALFAEAGKNQLHLALAELPTNFFQLHEAGMVVDQNTITCLRSVLMKPEHREWLDRIYEILSRSADRIVKRVGV
ncbi:MAG: aspartate aminotransferase family protein [Ignavibacteriales bacterium]|nr:aspartate aminotransferase family protein [Ignavibacteriales bacterium]